MVTPSEAEAYNNFMCSERVETWRQKSWYNIRVKIKSRPQIERVTKVIAVSITWRSWVRVPPPQ